MDKFIKMLSGALRWLRIAYRLFLILRYCSEEIMLLVAVSRAEILGALEDNQWSGSDKKKWAVNYLKKHFLFKHKDIVEIRKLVQSAWVFKFHKEK
jgi:hypothetical protein